MSIDPVTAIIDVGGLLIDRIWPDQVKATEAKLELYKLQQSGELARIAGQLKINEVEAQNTSLFVSGWRPFCGWICGFGLLYQFIFYPITHGYLSHLEPLDMATLLTILGGLLGLGGLRTKEKIEGVAAK